MAAFQYGPFSQKPQQNVQQPNRQQAQTQAPKSGYSAYAPQPVAYQAYASRSAPSQTVSGAPDGAYAGMAPENRPAPFQVGLSQTPWGQSADPAADRQAVIGQLNQQRMQRQQSFNQTSQQPGVPSWWGSAPQSLDYGAAVKGAGLGKGSPSLNDPNSWMNSMNQQYAQPERSNLTLDYMPGTARPVRPPAQGTPYSPSSPIDGPLPPVQLRPGQREFNDAIPINYPNRTPIEGAYSPARPASPYGQPFDRVRPPPTETYDLPITFQTWGQGGVPVRMSVTPDQASQISEIMQRYGVTWSEAGRAWEQDQQRQAVENRRAYIDRYGTDDERQQQAMQNQWERERDEYARTHGPGFGAPPNPHEQRPWKYAPNAPGGFVFTDTPEYQGQQNASRQRQIAEEQAKYAKTQAQNQANHQNYLVNSGQYRAGVPGSASAPQPTTGPRGVPQYQIGQDGGQWLGGAPGGAVAARLGQYAGRPQYPQMSDQEIAKKNAELEASGEGFGMMRYYRDRDGQVKVAR